MTDIQSVALLNVLRKVNARLSRWQRYGIEAGVKGRDSDFEDLRKQIDRAISGCPVESDLEDFWKKT